MVETVSDLKTQPIYTTRRNFAKPWSEACINTEKQRKLASSRPIPATFYLCVPRLNYSSARDDFNCTITSRHETSPNRKHRIIARAKIRYSQKPKCPTRTARKGLRDSKSHEPVEEGHADEDNEVYFFIVGGASAAKRPRIGSPCEYSVCEKTRPRCSVGFQHPRERIDRFSNLEKLNGNVTAKKKIDTWFCLRRESNGLLRLFIFRCAFRERFVTEIIKTMVAY